MAKHISGPWICEHFPEGSAIKKYNDHGPHENCSGNLVVADVAGNSEICRANAELIAAAPDLLTAIEALFSRGSEVYGPSCPFCLLEIRDPELVEGHSPNCLVGIAIAKARGGR